MRVLKGFERRKSAFNLRRAATLACALALSGICGAANAAVAVLLEQPYGKLNLVAPAGHAAIYLNHVCAATPLKLRACRPGELGVVLSRYDGVGDHDWIAMPLIPYLYAVPSPEEIPNRVDGAGESKLRNAYRREYLEAIAADGPDGSYPSGNWYELVGSAFDRTIYGFQVDTTKDQDAKLISVFNDGRNTERYNGMWRNCADFARVTVNLFYPHAVRRNYIADLGMTSPKSVARGLAHYARKHPETGFKVFVIPQVEGDLPRSHANVTLAEGILKRYGLPLVVLSPMTTGVMVAAYIGHGRFSMPKDAPLLDVSEVQPQEDIWRPFEVGRPVLPAPAAVKRVMSSGGDSAGRASVAHDAAAMEGVTGAVAIARPRLMH